MILDTLRTVDRDVDQVNLKLDATLAVANAVKADTGDILGQARAAHRNASCIDKKVLGPYANQGDCT